MKKSTETTVEPTSKVCKVCNTEKPIADFRLHKSGYRLGKCYDCEKQSWKSRSKKTTSKPAPGLVIPITTKSGGTFDVYTYPIEGGKKVTSPNTDKVLYVPATLTRDQARAVFQVYANVPRTGISVAMAE